jgi:hypothetical protein
VVIFSGTKIHLIDQIMLRAVTAFLNYSISENVDKVGKVEIASSTRGGSTNSRHLAKP